MTSSRLRATTALLASGVAGALLLVCTACSAGVATAPIADATTTADVTVAPMAATSTAPRTIVTIGDSIMAGFGLDDPSQAWPALLAAATGDTVVNLGCSGAGFVVAGDCGTDYAGLIDQAVAAQPDLVIVQSSDNDMDETQATLDAATASTVTALREALPNARIVGLNTLWNPTFDDPAAITWSSDALRAAVTDAGGDFVSIGQPLQGRDDLLQWDLEHPDPAGQIVLCDAIQQALTDAGILL